MSSNTTIKTEATSLEEFFVEEILSIKPHLQDSTQLQRKTILRNPVLVQPYGYVISLDVIENAYNGLDPWNPTQKAVYVVDEQRTHEIIFSIADELNKVMAEMAHSPATPQKIQEWRKLFELLKNRNEFQSFVTPFANLLQDAVSKAAAQLQPLPQPMPVPLPQFQPQPQPPPQSVAMPVPANSAADDRRVAESNSVIVVNLHASSTSEELFQLASRFGTIVDKHIELHTNPKYQRTRYAFFNYIRKEEAAAAAQGLNGYTHRGLRLKANLKPPSKPPSQQQQQQYQYHPRKPESAIAQFSSSAVSSTSKAPSSQMRGDLAVYVSNINKQTTNDELLRLAASYGQITDTVIKLRTNQKLVSDTRFAFFNYKTKEDAMNAVRSLDGLPFKGYTLRAKSANLSAVPRRTKRIEYEIDPDINLLILETHSRNDLMHRFSTSDVSVTFEDRAQSVDSSKRSSGTSWASKDTPPTPSYLVVTGESKAAKSVYSELTEHIKRSFPIIITYIYRTESELEYIKYILVKRLWNSKYEPLPLQIRITKATQTEILALGTHHYAYAEDTSDGSLYGSTLNERFGNLSIGSDNKREHYKVTITYHASVSERAKTIASHIEHCALERQTLRVSFSPSGPELQRISENTGVLLEVVRTSASEWELRMLGDPTICDFDEAENLLSNEEFTHTYD